VTCPSEIAAYRLSSSNRSWKNSVARRTCACSSNSGTHFGIALRFARVLGYRPDKSVDEVDTLDSVIALGTPATADGESE